MENNIIDLDPVVLDTWVFQLRTDTLVKVEDGFRDELSDAIAHRCLPNRVRIGTYRLAVRYPDENVPMKI